MANITTVTADVGAQRVDNADLNTALTLVLLADATAVGPAEVSGPTETDITAATSRTDAADATITTTAGLDVTAEVAATTVSYAIDLVTGTNAYLTADATPIGPADVTAVVNAPAPTVTAVRSDSVDVSAAGEFYHTILATVAPPQAMVEGNISPQVDTAVTRADDADPSPITIAVALIETVVRFAAEHLEPGEVRLVGAFAPTEVRLVHALVGATSRTVTTTAASVDLLR